MTFAPSKLWILPLIAGILYVVLGAYVLSKPVNAYITLSFFFALSFLVSGVIESYVAYAERGIRQHWGWTLAGGILDILIGLLLLNNPTITEAVLPFVVGFALLFRSSFAVAGSFALKSAGGQNWGWVLVFGLLGMLTSFILLWNPALAGLTIVVWTGMALLFVGFTRIFAAFAVKKGVEAIA